MSRIFFLEATLFTLHLDEQVIQDADGSTEFLVKIDLLDLPSLVVPANGFMDYSCCENNSDHYVGRACHFVAKQRDIAQALKGKPLRIGVYRENERFPRCHGIVPFSGCICDLVSKSIEETSSFEFAGTFNLVDPGGNPAGKVVLSIVLTDLGKHVITSYALDYDCFLSKNEPEGQEYKCGRLKDSDSNSFGDGSYGMTSAMLAPEKFMRDTAGISLGALRLSRGKQEAKIAARQSLEYLEVTGDESKVQEGKANKKEGKKGSARKTKER